MDKNIMDKNLVNIVNDSDNLLSDINKYSSEYLSDEAKFAYSKEGFTQLDKVLKNGFNLVKSIVENKYFEDSVEVTCTCKQIILLKGTLDKTEEKAKNLFVQDAIKIWQQLVILFACLANEILDIHENETIE